MKLNSIILRSNTSIIDSTKDSIISTAIGYGKMYELLHKQLWRKNRISFVDHEMTINDRPVKAIKYWNIKSYSQESYDRDDFYRLGLNQLFVGQSPYDAYDGDPKDGIYHDDCLIQPKAFAHESLSYDDMIGWTIKANTWVVTNEGEAGGYYDMLPRLYVSKYNSVGDIFIDEVIIEERISETVLIGYTAIFKKDGNVIQSEDYALDETFEYENFTTLYNYPKTVTFDASSFGELIHEEEGVPYTQPIGVSGAVLLNYLLHGTPTTTIKVFSDGTCIQIMPSYSYESYVDGDTQIVNVPPKLMYLPLVYMDSGDLVINRSDFIEHWDDMYELYVHEDSYWYSGLIKIATVVVSFIIAYMSSGTLSPLSQALVVMGSTIGSLGALSGNKFMQIIGVVSSLYGFVASGVSEKLAKEAMLQGFSEKTANQIAKESLMQMSFGEMFTSYISHAGFKNLLDLASMTNSVMSLSMQTHSYSSEEITQEEERVSVMIEDDEADDYVSKIMKIGAIQ
jgi:hypothetical protein